MIFNCPNCDKKYQVADSIIGDEGKKLRCVSCAHEWLQKPEMVELDFVEREEDEIEKQQNVFNDEQDDAFDDFETSFPQSDIDVEDDNLSESDKTAEKIRALIEGSNTAANEEQDDIYAEQDEVEEEESDDELPPIPKSVKPGIAKEAEPANNNAKLPVLAKINGIVAAMAIFMIVFIVSIFFRGDIVRAWPASAMIFDKAGFSVGMQGEGLVIENFKAKALENENGETSLVMRGRVVNLSNKTITVPDMIVYFSDEQSSDDSTSWIIEPPVKELTAGESYSFTSDYDNPAEDLNSIVLTFRQQFI